MELRMIKKGFQFTKTIFREKNILFYMLLSVIRERNLKRLKVWIGWIAFLFHSDKESF